MHILNLKNYALVALVAGLSVASPFGREAAAQATDRSAAILLVSTTVGAEPEAEHAWKDVAKALGRDGTIRIAADEAVAAFGHKAVPVVAVAKELNVRFVFTGTFAMGNETFEVVGELTDAVTGKSLWVGKFFSDEDNIGTLPTEIASALGTAIRGVAL